MKKNIKSITALVGILFAGVLRVGDELPETISLNIKKATTERPMPNEDGSLGGNRDNKDKKSKEAESR